MYYLLRYAKGLPVLITVLALLICSAGWSLGATTLDLLLIHSIGGDLAYERLRTLSSISAEGRLLLNGQPGTFQMHVAFPDQIYLQLAFGEFTSVQAFDGSDAWELDHNGGVTTLSGFQRRELINQLYLQTYSFMLPGGLDGGAEYGGIVERDSAEFHLVYIYPLWQDTILQYLGLTDDQPSIMESDLDGLTTIAESSDMRLVEGIIIPFYSRTTAVGAPVVSEMFVESITFDSTLDASLFVRPRSTLKDYRLPGGADSVVIDFTSEAGHVYLPAMVNGSTRVRLILDSGASINVLHQPSVATLDLPVVGEIPGRGISGYAQVQLVQTDSLSIGGLTLYGQIAGMTDLGRIGKGSSSDVPFGGILGYDFLSRFPVMIDFERQQLIVYDPKTFETRPGGTVVPFWLTSKVPTIDAELIGIPGAYIVDLGNSIGLVLHSDFVKRHDLLSKLDDTQSLRMAVGGMGGALSGRSAYAETFSFGDIRIDSIRVIILDESTGLSGSEELAGNIGSFVLKQFKMLFDYGRSELVFYPRESAAN